MKVATGHDKAKLRPYEELIIACEDMDLSWYPAEVDDVIRRWKAGAHLGDIAAKIRRDPDEIAILIIHLARKGQIRKRPGGAYGEPKKFPDNVREMLGG